MTKSALLCKTQICFSIRINAELDVLTPEIISKELGITPSRFFNKGDTIVSKYSPVIGRHGWSLWVLESPWTILDTETVSHHIEYLKGILWDKVDIIRRYKTDARLDISFWIWTEADNSGHSLELTESELEFLHCFASRVSFSFIYFSEV